MLIAPCPFTTHLIACIATVRTKFLLRCSANSNNFVERSKTSSAVNTGGKPIAILTSTIWLVTWQTCPISFRYEDPDLVEYTFKIKWLYEEDWLNIVAAKIEGFEHLRRECWIIVMSLCEAAMWRSMSLEKLV